MGAPATEVRPDTCRNASVVNGLPFSIEGRTGRIFDLVGEIARIAQNGLEAGIGVARLLRNLRSSGRGCKGKPQRRRQNPGESRSPAAPTARHQNNCQNKAPPSDRLAAAWRT